MKTRHCWIVLPLVAAFVFSSPVREGVQEQNKGLVQDVRSAIKENKFLQEEMALSRNSALYVVVDIQKKVITLRVKGLVLKEWPIRSVRLWGSPPPYKALTILKKTSMSVPQRIKIKPGETTENGKVESSSKFELEALEITDMPTTYTLVLESNTLIYIRPETASFKARLYEIGHFIKWQVGLPLENLWLTIKKSPKTMIDIKLAEEKECKGFYWALTDKIKAIVNR